MEWKYSKKFNRFVTKDGRTKKSLDSHEDNYIEDAFGYIVSSGVGVHRIVADAFIKNTENKETVNHIDGNKKNNCVDNLEYATRKEQYEHAKNMGLIKNDKTPKKVIKRCSNTGEVVDEFPSKAAAARYHNMSVKNIERIINTKKEQDLIVKLSCTLEYAD